MVSYSKAPIIILLLVIFMLAQLKTFGQYLYEDRVNLVNGASFSGIITEDKKPEYLKIKTQEFGIVQLDYKDIKRVFRRADFTDPFFKKLGHQYLSISAGIGQSYGGIGIRFQQRGGRKVGFAYSVGFGVNKIPEYLYYSDLTEGKYVLGLSIAAKFYAYKWTYLELGILNELVDIMNIRAKPYAMVGYDYSINKNLVINAGIGYYDSDYFILNTGNLAIDIGIMYKFSVKY